MLDAARPCAPCMSTLTRPCERIHIKRPRWPEFPERVAKFPEPHRDMWFDLAAFRIVPDSELRFGNSGRNILDGSGNIALNLTLSKAFHIGSRGRLQFRCEADSSPLWRESGSIW